MTERPRPYVPPIAVAGGMREGFFKRKKRSGGVDIPVRFWRGPTPDPANPDEPQDRSHVWHAFERGEEVDAKDIPALWNSCYGNPISEQEYLYLLDRARWATEHEPSDPHASPSDPIDLDKMPSLF